MQFIDCKWVRENYKIFNNKRVVIITGAGISVNSGIPDFRSKNGIFNEIKQSLKVQGSDLFTYRYSIQPETRPKYLKFIYKLKELTDESKPTETHNFFVKYKNFSKKMHIYTQNIDGLEEKAGLIFSKESKNTEIIYLHGNMKFLKCSYCGYQIPFTKTENLKFKISEEIECINCLEREKKRKENHQRSTPIGVMNTTIIHYYQSHPESSFISEMVSKDTDLNLFIVMGTSLQIYGIKKIVKYFGFSNRNNKGVSIYVNKEEPRSEFKDVFDFQWKGDCDEFCKEILNLLETKPIETNESHSSILKIKETTKNEKNIRKSLDKLTISQNKSLEKSIDQPKVQKGIKKEIKEETKKEICKEIKKDVYKEMKKGICKEIENKKDIFEDNKNDIKKEIEKEIHKGIKNEIQEEIIKETQEENKKDVYKETQEDIIKETQEDIKKEIIKEIQEDIKKEIQEVIIKEIQEDIIKDVYKETQEDIIKETQEDIKKDIIKEIQEDIKKDVYKEIIISSESKVKTCKYLSKIQELSTPKKSFTIKIKKKPEIKNKNFIKNKEFSINPNNFHEKQIQNKISETNFNTKNFENETKVSNFVKNKNKNNTKQTMKNKSEIIFTNEYSTITKVHSDSSEEKLFIFDKCESSKIEGMDCDDLKMGEQSDEKNEENGNTEKKKTQENLKISIDDVKNVVRNIADLSSNAYIMESKPETVNKVDYVDSNTESSNCFMSKYSNTENLNCSEADTNVIREYTVEETDSVDQESEEEKQTEYFFSPEIIIDENNSPVEEDQCYGELIDEKEFHEVNEPEIKISESQIESSINHTGDEKTEDEQEQDVAIKTRPKRKSSKRFSTSYYRTTKKTGNKKKKSIPASKQKINESEVISEPVDNKKPLTTENSEDYKREGSFVVGEPTKEKGIKAFTKVVSKETNEK
ncbi:Sir2-like telomeric silencing protein [Hamiltosporidium tvaerminnensis]|uniref:Sir2-like telomeric silencing protein n=1 Tax=Hamiltosporidium tvaerminnensis TaxID=1176355 RepID=A0A4Q9M377_9MICR|nr:Sir2-like telomeric silencing protein [Hamiltosporidium tvaerminnensis]